MSKNNCTYRFTGPDGQERTIQGMAAMKAFLADGGLEFFYPDGKYPWLKTEAAQFGAKSGTKSGNITDFGEKIGGAKKDLWTGFKDDLAAVSDDDIASQPLSKVWPAPDYQALIESGTSPDVVAFIRAARDEIPAKPRVGYKVKGWASKVKTLRGLALDMISGKTTMKDVQAQMEKAGAISSSMQGFMGRVELYQAFGHGKSLEGIRMSWQHYTLYRGQQNVSMWVVEQDAKATAWSNFPRELATGKTKEEAIESFRKAYEKLGADKEAKKGVQFDIIHYRGQDGYWISKKLGRNHVKVHGPLATVKEAREYRDQHQAELVAKLEKIKEIPNERRETNEPRVGEDMRNGADVTPELFGQTFGFRGVEFGNWVEQGRRQRDLNDAFDALMDMAAILGIPPKAISLNGQLGLAFGARGTGGSGMVAAAHYEPDKVVINLTKKSGAGSLGHEWWHAVDNYFAKMRREQGGSFMTTSRDVLLASRGSSYVPYAGVRPEMIKAFGDVVKAINLTGMKQRAAVLDGKRSKEYWTTGEEMSARAYEAYLINKLQDQNVSNDYLANIVSEESWNAAAALGLENENSYPYPLSKEVPGIRAAFDNFFQTVQTREDDNGNVALFSVAPDSDLAASVEVASPAGSISQVELDSVIQGALNGWKAVGGDMIAAVQSASDLPAEIVQGAKDQGLDLSKVEGVQHRGKVYLVRDNLRGADHAQRVLFHEVLGHLGVKGALSGKTKETMRVLWAKLGGLKGVEAMARKIDAGDGKTVWDRLQPYTKGGALTMDRQAIIMDELIAYIAQSNDQRPLIRFRAYLSNLKADVVSLLRKLGLNTLADRLDKAGAELDVLALVRDARKAIETGKTRDGQSFTFTTNPGRPSFSQRTSSGNQIPDAIIGHKLGDLNRHPDYAAAKGGDVEAAFRIATDMVDDAMVEKVRAAAGGADIIVPVVSVEASGRNKIPLAVAQVLADKLGNKANAEIIQVNSPKRTAMDGLDRLLSPPVFDGPVEAGTAYVMVDDALTQGGTFASMASHIIDNGGRVAGAVALTGKQYSAKLSPSPELLSQVRDRYQSVEAQFRAATGYGFDALTESEARYLAKHDNAQLVRDRITEAGDAARQRATQGNDRGSQGLTDLGGADTRFSVASSGQPSSWASPAESAFDNLIYKMQDKNIDAKRVVESITKTVGAIKDSLNVYLQEELFHGRAAKRVADFGARELTPMLNQMRMANLSMDEVEEFLHARHAKEANAVIAQRNPDNPDMQDGGSGMTNAEADAYFAKLPAAQRAKLEAVAKRVDAIIADTRKLYVDYGLEDQAVVDGWTGMFKHYIPLMRENKDGGMGIGQGFSVKGKEVKGRTGSKRKVVDIVANIAAQREKVIVRGEKNRVSQALVGLAWANPNKGFWEVRSQAPTERVYDDKLKKVVDRPDPMFKSRDNVLGAKVKDSKGNVTEQFVVFNEDDPRAMRMAAALKNLDAGNLEGLLGVSAKITRYFSAINTQYNPVFGVVNLVRDVQGAMVNLAATPLAGQQAKIAKDTASALAGIYGDIRKTRKGGQATSQWAKLWEQMQEDGGTTGYRDLFKTSADRAESLKSIINPDAWMDSKWGKVFTADGKLKVPMSYAKKHAGALFDWLSDYNEAMENGVRLAAYKAALDKGMSREQAASLAKNLTVNFNRKGQVGQQAGAVYAFFNAAMQGTARIGQTLFDMDGGNIKTLRLSKVGKTVVYGGVLLGAMQALALAGAGFDEKDPPEFVRERSIVIPTPVLFGGKPYITIPMPLGLHVIPGLGRHAVEFALSGFDKPAQRAVSVMGMFMDAFNPIGNAGMSLQTIAPTAIDPLVALAENKDYTGSPIARKSFNPALPGHAQWKDSATGVAKVIAEAINWISGGNEYVAGAFSPTPDQIDYLIAQVGGGVAREASKIMQTASSVMTGEELPAHKIPLLGRFYGNAQGQASQGNAFYANVNKLNELETEIKGLRGDGKYAEVAQLMRDRPEASLIAAANKAERDVQKLRRDKRDLIERGADRSEVKAKEDQITSVMARLNDLVKGREEVDQ